MKLLFIVLFLIPALSVAAEVIADQEQVIRLSEPVEVTENHEVFGAPMPQAGSTWSLADLIAARDELQDQAVLVETEIAQVCQKKGCFFIARDGDAVARIRFKDYGFFIPTDAGGKTVVLAGSLNKVELSADQAAHFAEDLGDDSPESAKAGFEYQITATSVRIPLG